MDNNPPIDMDSLREGFDRMRKPESMLGVPESRDAPRPSGMPILDDAVQKFRDRQQARRDNTFVPNRAQRRAMEKRARKRK